jgi:hypothetical protein
MLRRPPRPSEPGQLNLTRVSVRGMFGSAKANGGSEIPLRCAGAAVEDGALDGLSPSSTRFPESFARLSACRDSGDIAMELGEPRR